MSAFVYQDCDKPVPTTENIFNLPLDTIRIKVRVRMNAITTVYVRRLDGVENFVLQRCTDGREGYVLGDSLGRNITTKGK